MTCKRTSALMMTALLLCIVGSAFAQGASNARRLYDPSTEITLKGTIARVTEISGRGAWNGTHLTLQTDNRAYDVHLGPSDYVSNSGFKFSTGDQIEVTGSKLQNGGVEMIVAREIKKGDKVLTLRNRQGIPQWSQGRRRSY